MRLIVSVISGSARCKHVAHPLEGLALPGGQGRQVGVDAWVASAHRSNPSTAARIASGIGVAGRAGSVLSTYTTTTRPSAAAASSPWKSPTR